VIQRVLSSSALALESTMSRLRRLREGGESPKAQPEPENIPAPPPLEINDRAGRIEHDSRGSAVWNWAREKGAAALENTQRLLKRLETPALTLDESPPDAKSKPPTPTRDTGGGYDPYNRGKPAKRR
jgi:hypothetical protein